MVLPTKLAAPFPWIQEIHLEHNLWRVYLKEFTLGVETCLQKKLSLLLLRLRGNCVQPDLFQILKIEGNDISVVVFQIL